MAAPMGQGGVEPILEPIDYCGIAFVILFGKTDDYRAGGKKHMKSTVGVILLLWYCSFLQKRVQKVEGKIRVESIKGGTWDVNVWGTEGRDRAREMNDTKG